MHYRIQENEKASLTHGEGHPGKGERPRLYGCGKFSRRGKMATAKDYVQNLDWQSAIAVATLELDALKTQGQTTPTASVNPAESYLYRGIARCFIAGKEGKHKEAVEDLSKAIVLGVAVMNEAYYYRAYAFYLDGEYEKAIADCKNINSSPQKDELFGKIYFTMSNYHETVKRHSRAIKCYNQKAILPPPGLLDSYREACKRMNSV